VSDRITHEAKLVKPQKRHAKAIKVSRPSEVESPPLWSYRPLINIAF